MSDIEAVLKPQLEFGTIAERGQVTQSDINDLMDDADGILDGELSHMYMVPFRQYSDKGVLKYPQQIITLSALKVSSLLLNKYFGETEPGLSDRAKELDARYEKLQMSIFTGDTLLKGQRRRARTHFVTPGIQEAPGTATQGGGTSGTWSR